MRLFLISENPIQRRIACAAIALAAVISAQTGAKPLYRISELVDPLGPNRETVGVDINDYGAVIADSRPQGWFMWQHGGAIYSSDLDQYRPLRINNHGQVSGRFRTLSTSEGWLWDRGSYLRLQDLPGGQSWSVPTGLTDNGDVYGYSHAGTDNLETAVSWRADGTIVDQGLSDYVFNRFETEDASDQGVLVGVAYTSNGSRRYRAWKWDGGDSVFLPEPDALPLLATGEVQSGASSINENGQIAGTIRVGDTLYATVWGQDGATVLPHLPDGTAGWANDINDNGFIVGVAAESAIRNAVLWSPKGSIYNLSDAVINGDGWRLEEARAINNRGDIVGNGINPYGYRRGFVLTIVPEPSSAILLGLAVVAIAILARRLEG